MRKVWIDQECWDGGCGPLNENSMEELGLEEIEKPLDPVVLAVYRDRGGKVVNSRLE